MANHLGKEGVLKVSTTTVAEIRGYALNESAATVEDTVIGDEWTTHQTTQRSFQVSGDLFWDETDTGQISLTVGSTVTLNLYPEGIGSGATYKQGSAIIVGFDITARHDSMIEASFSAQGTGTLSTLTV
jgi:predicted secreted protein